MKKLMVVLLTAVCIIISVNAFAEKKDYVIAVQDLPEYLPESSFQNKEYTGFGRELLDMFAKSYGYNFTYYHKIPLDFNLTNRDFS